MKRKTIMDTIIYLIVKIKKDDIFGSGAQLAYYLMLAFFPFLIFLITVIGLSHLNSSDILEGLYKILPKSVFDLTKNIVLEVVNNQHTGILGISGIITIWSASTGIRGVIKSVNRAYEVD